MSLSLDEIIAREKQQSRAAVEKKWEFLQFEVSYLFRAAPEKGSWKKVDKPLNNWSSGKPSDRSAPYSKVSWSSSAPSKSAQPTGGWSKPAAAPTSSRSGWGNSYHNSSSSAGNSYVYNSTQAKGQSKWNKDGTIVKISNIPWDLTHRDVQTAFENNCGHVQKCEVNRGTAWLTFQGSYFLSISFLLFFRLPWRHACYQYFQRWWHERSEDHSRTGLTISPLDGVKELMLLYL